jgi:pyruvate/2-oxoglutarate dehydrogenase complex dihydrolipoamide acyltransferase (E2) component
MRAEIILPELGSSPLKLSLWFADPGDAVFEGDRLVEILAGGATFDVPAPATGRLVERCALPDDPLIPGQVLGLVEVEEDGISDNRINGK